MRKGEQVYVHYIDARTGQLCCERGVVEQIYPPVHGTEDVYMVRLPASKQYDDRGIYCNLHELGYAPHPGATMV